MQRHDEAGARGLRFERDHWALILGGSSGFGLAAARKLARHGMSLAIVHRDRRGAMPAIEAALAEVRAEGVDVVSFNVDALAASGRQTVLAGLAERLGDAGRVRLLMHSIAFGNLKLLAPVPSTAGEAAARARARLAEHLGVSPEAVAEAVAAIFPDADGSDPLALLAEPPTFDAEALLDEEDFSRTVHSMGTSLATWARELLGRGLFAADARIIGLTSEGNEVAWRGYAAVAAAKVALEAVARAMALELAPYGVRSNIVQPGVTDTRALQLIPGSAHLKAAARRRNPFGRLTTPDDVADVICLLCTDEAAWINGAIVRADGGEHIVG